MKGQLFPEVAAQLQQWHSQGIKVYIYSSGSREAQKLLLANSTDGDLRPHISGLFDTTVGAKVSLLFASVTLVTYLKCLFADLPQSTPSILRCCNHLVDGALVHHVPKTSLPCQAPKINEACKASTFGKGSEKRKHLS